MDDSVVTDTKSVQVTRDLLADGDDAHVVGWVDLTSPHLVDLLDELLTGPGGHRLVAVWSDAVGDHLDEMPISRGLGTLRDSHLAFHTLDPELRARLHAHSPRLRLHP